MKKKRLHMAHNIYSNPVLKETSGKFDGFSIDFRGVETPVATYWALCNWGMDLTTFKAEHPDAKGCGAYAGLQHTIHGNTAIMAFWETMYDNDKKRHNASRVYPAGKDRAFGGEGEGTNYITPFDWEANKWYRMVLRSWCDAERGTTFVGQWVQDRESGKWSLISYFDTKLKDSFMRGGMSQFQENYWQDDSEPIRSFNIKNIFVLDRSDKAWKYLPRTSLGIDDPAWHFNTAGTHDFGATTEYFYGSTGGDVEDQIAYDAQRPINALYALPIADKLPTVEEESAIAKAEISSEKGKHALSFEIAAGDAPILEISALALDKEGKVLSSVSQTRPEMTTLALPEADAYKVTFTNLYGKATTITL